MLKMVPAVNAPPLAVVPRKVPFDSMSVPYA